MRITWLGHASFRIETGDLSIVTDPFTPGPEASGLSSVEEPADLVLMSSSLDEAHSYAAGIPGDPLVVDTLNAVAGALQLPAGITVHAIAAEEGLDRPDDPKANAIYWWQLEGLTLCHMGDVGRALTSEQLAALPRRPDVLFTLAGAGLVIGFDDLEDVVAALEPRVLIPMHYRTPGLLYGAAPIEEFLAYRDGERVERIAGSSIELEAGSIPRERTTFVLLPQLDPKLATHA